MAMSAREAFLRAVDPAKEDQEPDHLGALVKIAELAASTSGFKQRITELKAATEAARAAVVEAGRERAAVAKLREDAETEVAKTRADISAQREQHERLMAKLKQDFDSEIRTVREALKQERAAVASERSLLKQKAEALRSHLESAA